MNVLNKVTLQSLKKNKVRTIVTIIGIMLSAAMICAVTTFVASLQNYLYNYTVYNQGDWYGMVESVDWNAYTDISSNGDVSSAVYGQLVGYAEIDSKNEYKPYLFVIGGEKGAFEKTMPIHVTSGSYPKNSGEILLPEHLQSNGGVTHQLGDTLTLNLGDRMLDGYPMNQHNPCYVYEKGEEVPNGETLSIRETRTYTVVGFYSRPDFEPYTAPGYTAITITDGQLSSRYTYDVYFKAKDPEDIYGMVESFTDTYQTGGQINDDVLTFIGVSLYDGFSTVLYSMAVIAILLIMFGSVSLIYNAFSISVSERTKQFGLLSSLGATKKQLHRMVLFEALAVSAIGIPLGIAVGLGGIAVTLQLIGHRFSMLIGYDMPMRVCVSGAAVVIACIVALVTVLISAWIPSRRATKVTAVEAIRQQQDIRAKEKPVKTSRLTYFFFGLPGVLAAKHYKRNKKKYRATVASLFMSIVLFVTAAVYTDGMMSAVDVGFDTGNYDLWLTLKDAEQPMDQTLALLRGEEKVDAAAAVRFKSLMADISKSYLTNSIADRIDSMGYSDGHEAAEGAVSINAGVYFVDDDSFRTLLKQYRLSESEYMNPDAPLAIAIDVSTPFDPADGKYIQLDLLKGNESEITATITQEKEGYTYFESKIDENGEMVDYYTAPNGETVTAEEAEIRLTLTMASGKTITETPWFVNRSYMLTMVYPVCVQEAVVPDSIALYDGRYFIKADDHNGAEQDIKRALDDSGAGGYTIYNAAADNEANRNVITIIRVFAYGFIVLISMISAANVFNTISTNISLRRREFAMLKSVGMTAGGFNRMMNFECLLYGSRALLWGLPVSLVLAYLIHVAMSDGFEYAFQIPWGPMGIAVLSVFAVVFVTMLYAMSKIKRDNPIDALKNENL